VGQSDEAENFSRRPTNKRAQILRGEEDAIASAGGDPPHTASELTAIDADEPTIGNCDLQAGGPVCIG
jgi:hypothetical protein